jgi:ABC-type multidrug transport system ATPase subunit
MTGEINMSAGQIYVRGKSVRTELAAVRRMIGCVLFSASTM